MGGKKRRKWREMADFKRGRKRFSAEWKAQGTRFLRLSARSGFEGGKEASGDLWGGNYKATLEWRRRGQSTRGLSARSGPDPEQRLRLEASSSDASTPPARVPPSHFRTPFFFLSNHPRSRRPINRPRRPRPNAEQQRGRPLHSLSTPSIASSSSSSSSSSSFSPPSKSNTSTAIPSTSITHATRRFGRPFTASACPPPTHASRARVRLMAT